MPKLRDVTRAVRSKAAGPFWVTVDVFFDTEANFRAYARSLEPAAVARLYRVPVDQIRVFPVDPLLVLKISYPRATPQGWIEERDLHSGQQYVRLLDLELGTAMGAAA